MWLHKQYYALSLETVTPVTGTIKLMVVVIIMPLPSAYVLFMSDHHHNIIVTKANQSDNIMYMV